MPPIIDVRRTRRWNVTIGWFLASALALTACGGPTGGEQELLAPATAQPTAEATATAALAAAERMACATGELTIADLPLIDEQWRDGLASAKERATTWESDSQLTSLRVSCELLEPGFRWQAIYYSPTAQAFLATDTGETEPAEVDPSIIPTLPEDDLSFGLLRRSLAKSGYGDTTVLNATTGVDVRLNSADMPFGPPQAPLDVILYHVAIEHLGEVKDLFVASSDGTVYRYAPP